MKNQRVLPNPVFEGRPVRQQDWDILEENVERLAPRSGSGAGVSFRSERGGTLILPGQTVTRNLPAVIEGGKVPAGNLYRWTYSPTLITTPGGASAYGSDTYNAAAYDQYYNKYFSRSCDDEISSEYGYPTQDAIWDNNVIPYPYSTPSTEVGWPEHWLRTYSGIPYHRYCDVGIAIRQSSPCATPHGDVNKAFDIFPPDRHWYVINALVGPDPGGHSDWVWGTGYLDYQPWSTKPVLPVPPLMTDPTFFVWMESGVPLVSWSNEFGMPDTEIVLNDLIDFEDYGSVYFILRVRHPYVTGDAMTWLRQSFYIRQLLIERKEVIV